MICPICQVGTMVKGVCNWCGAPTQVREDLMRKAHQHVVWSSQFYADGEALPEDELRQLQEWAEDYCNERDSFPVKLGPEWVPLADPR